MLEDGTYIIVTHSGSFHSDEVLAVAVLKLVLTDKPVKIIRTRDPEIIKTGDFVVDIGAEYDPDKNRFDHHQKGGAGERENGIPYSALGLVWKKYGEQLCGDRETALIVEERLVWPIDAADNGCPVYTSTMEGVDPYLLHNVTEIFRPTWKEHLHGKSEDDAFEEMLEWATTILVRELRRAHDMLDGEQAVHEAYGYAPDKRLVVIDGHYPYERVLSRYPEPLFVVKPHQDYNDRKWKIEAVREDPKKNFNSRKDLPKHWAGKYGGKLRKATGIEGAVYCHDKLFVAVADTKNDAIALARLAIDYDPEKNGYADNGEHEGE